MKSVMLKDLSPLSRELAETSLAWMEPYGNTACHLLRYPGKRGHYSVLDVEADQPHLVRESVWWAIGLLLRNEKNDTTQAERILDAVLRWQFNEPGQPYHGTFHRAPEEKLPPKEKAVMLTDYDPNWRQFIGTCFLIILEKLSDHISPAMSSRLKDSIRLAVEGETPERISPEYSNIAMMQSVMLVQAGALFQEERWRKEGLLLARQVYALFAEHETFAEYNSPTYYGVILYGLRLWKLESSGPELQEWGAKMETALWQHVASYFHPGLRNICGPFDRAYGMDMTKYAAGIGLWMRLELEPALAPAPSCAEDFDHQHDFVMAPVIALLGAEIPADLCTKLREVPNERVSRQIIETKPSLRVATICLQRDRMWGGESGSKACGWNQFHAATAHWSQPDGTLGWLRLENEMWVDVTADAKGLLVTASNGADAAQMIWHLSVSGKPIFNAKKWDLPGMIVHLKGDLAAPIFTTKADGISTVIYEMPPQTKGTLELEFIRTDS